jgi:hypothetical protein
MLTVANMTFETPSLALGRRLRLQDLESQAR